MTNLPEDFVTQLAAEWMVSRGYTVTPDVERQSYIKQHAYAARLGITPQTLCGYLKQEDCPQFDANYGPSGRMVDIRPNPILDQWITDKQK